MKAILRKELKAYFSSPIGYIFLAVFYAFSGFYFFATALLLSSADISGVFSGMFMIVMFLIPILTMRLFSEELKHKTDQALLTAPISLTALVIGKFLACVLVFLAGLMITLVYGVVVSFFATPNWAWILGNFTAMLLLGMAVIAIGLFLSSMTESQVLAAVGTFAVSLALILSDSLNAIITSPAAARLLTGLSFMRRYMLYTRGIFDLSNAVFFLSVSAAFLFLTIRMQEKRRWS